MIFFRKSMHPFRWLQIVKNARVIWRNLLHRYDNLDEWRYFGLEQFHYRTEYTRGGNCEKQYKQKFTFPRLNWVLAEMLLTSWLRALKTNYSCNKNICRALIDLQTNIQASCQLVRFATHNENRRSRRRSRRVASPCCCHAALGASQTIVILTHQIKNNIGIHTPSRADAQIVFSDGKNNKIPLPVSFLYLRTSTSFVILLHWLHTLKYSIILFSVKIKCKHFILHKCQWRLAWASKVRDESE